MDSTFFINAFLTTLLVTLIAAWVTLYVRRRNALESKVNEFITVFTDFIHVLETQGALFSAAMMKESIVQHEKASIRLKNTLNNWERFKFKRYWAQYRKNADKYYNAYAQLGFKKANEEMINAIEKLIKNIKRL